MKLNEKFQYELLSDTNKELAGYYGADSSIFGIPDRKTVVLDPLGNWILEYTDVSPKSHAAMVLQDMTAILGTTP